MLNGKIVSRRVFRGTNWRHMRQLCTRNAKTSIAAQRQERSRTAAYSGGHGCGALGSDREILVDGFEGEEGATSRRCYISFMPSEVGRTRGLQNCKLLLRAGEKALIPVRERDPPGALTIGQDTNACVAAAVRSGRRRKFQWIHKGLLIKIRGKSFYRGIMSSPSWIIQLGGKFRRRPSEQPSANAGIGIMPDL